MQSVSVQWSGRLRPPGQGRRLLLRVRPQPPPGVPHLRPRHLILDPPRLHHAPRQESHQRPNKSC